MQWNFNIEEAPKGETVEVAVGNKGGVRKVHKSVRILAAADDGETVTLSNWLEGQQRWNMFSKDRPPIAWAEWPEHPGTK